MKVTYLLSILAVLTTPAASVRMAAPEGTPAEVNAAGRPSTRNFANQAERAVIQRFGDKVFIGGATASDGSWPNVHKDWLSIFQSGLTDFYSNQRLNGSGLGSAFFVLNNDSPAQGAALVAGSRTQLLRSTGTSLANSAFCLNDNSLTRASCWAFYGEAHLTSERGGQAVGMELDVRSTVPTVKQTPFVLGNAQALQINCGAGVRPLGYPCSSAVMIGANPTPFAAGIVSYRGSGNNSRAVAISDGAFAPFISLDTADELVWYAGPGTETFRIVGIVDEAHSSQAVRIINDNYGLSIQNNDAKNVIQVDGAGRKVNINQWDGAAAFNVSGGMQLAPQRFAQLPRCNSASRGYIAFIIDAALPISNWHQEVKAGGGSSSAFVTCNGSAWNAFSS
jgi:hypothetical protein